MGGRLGLVLILTIILALPTALAKVDPPPASPCAVWLQANGHAWAKNFGEFAPLLTKHRHRIKWSSVIYNYRLILSQQSPTDAANLKLNPQWSAPLFKAMRTQNKLHQQFLRHLRYIFRAKAEQLVGPQAVFGRSMRRQIITQIKPAVQALEEHREVLPFFEDSFWPQLHLAMQDYLLLLQNGPTTAVASLQKAQDKIMVLLNKHTTLLPKEIFQGEKDKSEKDDPELAAHSAKVLPTSLFTQLEKLYQQMQTMTYFIHPFYEISPAERFLLQLLAWHNRTIPADTTEGDYYQTIREVYENLPFSPREIAKLFVKVQAQQRKLHPNLTANEQISIPQYQYWQDEMNRSNSFNITIHQIYKELLVSFWDAYATIHYYPNLEFQPYRRLLRQVAANLDQVLALDVQFAAPLHKRELEYVWHAQLIRQLRHRIFPLGK